MTINAGVLATGAVALAVARTGGFPGQKPGGVGGSAFGTLFLCTCGGAFEVLIGGSGGGAFDDVPDELEDPHDWLGFIGTP